MLILLQNLISAAVLRSALNRMGLPTGRQFVQAAQDKRLPPIGMIDVIELQIGQATQQRHNRNLALNAGELGADAVMNAAAE